RDLVGPDGESEPIAGLATRSVAAFCGIGNPEGFRRTLEPLCGRILDFRTFPDHHPYTSADVDDLTTWARSLGADLVLTTQKDSVKLRTANLGAIPLRALRIGLEVLSGASILDEALSKRLPSEP
ncbi:tetraacyldisaccharide 4'-kinase, partial [Singulisphaera rosea]